MNISVIIPIYNTSDYLKECIESVLSIRDEEKDEIILVNDGSTDNSLEICQEYAQKHKNIIVVDKENEGAAQARNCGILKAKGKYLLFLDSDDYYLHLENAPIKNGETLTPFSLLYQTAQEKELDVLSFNYTRSESKTAERIEKDYYIDDIEKLVEKNLYISSSCNKLIKRDILINNNIYFVKGNLAEDILFSGLLLNIPRIKIGFCNEVLYYYRIRNTSTTNVLTSKNIRDVFITIKELLTFDNELLLSYASFQYATLIINIHLSKDKIDKDLLKEIYNMSKVLKYNKSSVVRIIYLAKKILGIKLTSNLLAKVFIFKNTLSKKKIVKDKMRIMLIVPAISFGGLEKVAMETVEILKKDYEVYLIYFYDTKDKYQVANDVKSICLNTPASANKLSQAIAFLKRWVLINKYKRKYDIDYSFSIGKTASYSNAVTKNKGKSIVSLHGYSDVSNSKFINKIDSFLFNKADKIVFVSKALKEAFIDKSEIKRSKCSELYNPFDVLDIEKKSFEDAKLKFGTPTLFAYGRIVKEKNFELAILAVKELINEYPEAVLNILGDGDNKECLKHLVNKLDLNNNVVFLNATSNPYKYLSKADIYVNTSYNEGFGNTIIEAMICKTPIISVDCKVGIRENLAPNTDIKCVAKDIEKAEYGFLIKPSDFNDNDATVKESAHRLKDAIKLLYQDKELMSRYKNEAYIRSKEYDITKYRNDLTNILKEI